MAKNWRFSITGTDLNAYEQAFNELMDRNGPDEAYNFAFRHYFGDSALGGSGGKFWTQLVAKFGEAEAHNIVNTYNAGGGNRSEGTYRGYKAAYTTPALSVELPKPTYGRKGGRVFGRG